MIENLIEYGPPMSEEQLEKTKVLRAMRIFSVDELCAWHGDIPMTYELWDRCTTAAFTPQTMDIFNQLTIDYPDHVDRSVQEMTADLDSIEACKEDSRRSLQEILIHARILFGDRFMEEHGLMDLME